ncbi:hypothetical protein, partial [Cloacibacillus porcorum]|uniref:hypothetical protein n=1 Tax=Cloacibacillus porcorum TaxID=1197717 RepID=UPI0022E47B24
SLTVRSGLPARTFYSWDHTSLSSSIPACAALNSDSVYVSFAFSLFFLSWCSLRAVSGVMPDLGATKGSILFFRRIVNPFELLFYKDTRPRVFGYFNLITDITDIAALYFL